MVIDIFSPSADITANRNHLLKCSASTLNQPSLLGACTGIYILIDQILTAEENAPESELRTKQLQIAKQLLISAETCRVVISPSNIDKENYVIKMIDTAEDVLLYPNNFSDDLIEKASQLSRSLEGCKEEFIQAWKAFVKEHLGMRLNACLPET